MPARAAYKRGDAHAKHKGGEIREEHIYRAPYSEVYHSLILGSLRKFLFRHNWKRPYTGAE